MQTNLQPYLRDTEGGKEWVVPLACLGRPGNYLQIPLTPEHAATIIRDLADFLTLIAVELKNDAAKTESDLDRKV